MPAMDPKQLRDEIIMPTLSELQLDRDTLVQAMELLLGTAATESGLGFWLRQVEGPALGMWQMEPNTEQDCYLNYLQYRPELLSRVIKLRDSAGVKGDELATNHKYACAMARVKYRRSPLPLPRVGELLKQAEMWKRAYNSYLGKGTVEKYIADWNRLVKGKL